jgi:hypothetical protein
MLRRAGAVVLVALLGGCGGGTEPDEARNSTSPTPGRYSRTAFVACLEAARATVLNAEPLRELDGYDVDYEAAHEIIFPFGSPATDTRVVVFAANTTEAAKAAAAFRLYAVKTGLEPDEVRGVEVRRNVMLSNYPRTTRSAQEPNGHIIEACFDKAAD